MTTKEEDLFRMFYKTEMYEARLRDLKISEENIRNYLTEYKPLYERIISEVNLRQFTLDSKNELK